MDNSDLIKKLQDQVEAGVRDSYTEPLINMARAVLARSESSPEQQKELASLIEGAIKLEPPSTPRFLGSSATQL